MLEAFRRMVLEDRLGAALIRSGDSVIIKEVVMSPRRRCDRAIRVEPRESSSLAYRKLCARVFCFTG